MSQQNYRLFLEQADGHFNRVQDNYAQHMSCRSGCSSCCQSGLSVSEVERDNIRDYLLSHPSLRLQLESTPATTGKCAFLDSDGRCQIYPARPFICRSHGAPIAIAEVDHYRIDVCELNFTALPIEELPPDDFFILDEWNNCLSSYGSSKRFLLSPKGILDGIAVDTKPEAD